MAKEEETSTGSGSRARLEDLIAVLSRVQRSLDLLEKDLIHGAHPLEYTRGEGSDLGAWQRVRC